MAITKPRLLNQLILISLPFVKMYEFNIPWTILCMRKQATMVLLYLLILFGKKGF